MEESTKAAEDKRLFPEPVSVLETIQSFIDDRKKAGIPLTAEEREALRVLYSDAVHETLADVDDATYSELSRLKQIELEYLHQVRGVRQVMPSAIFGDGYAGYGNGWTGNKMRLLYAQDRKRAGRESKELIIPNPCLAKTAITGEHLVPIRLDFENDKYRFKDTFCWNIEGMTVPIDLFVENLLEDFALPNSLMQPICASIEEQLHSYVRHPLQQQEQQQKQEPKPESAAERPAAVENPDFDWRVVIKIDITSAQHTLKDQFEWDINEPENDPEEFAETFVKEMALPQEFATAVAHTIREQVQAQIKELMQQGYQFDGARPVSRDAACDFEVGPHTFLRPPHLLDEFSPSVSQLSTDEIQHFDRDRNNRRRGRRLGGRMSRRTAGGGAVPSLQPLSEVREIRNINTPYFNSLLPGGLDRNLDTLRSHIYQQDDTDSERPEVVYFFNRLRESRHVPSASVFSMDMINEDERRQRFTVKLKLPPRILHQFPRFGNTQ